MLDRSNGYFLDDSTLLICSPWTFLFSLFRDETVVISAKRFLLRPEVHYNQVHAVHDKKLKKMKLSVPVSDFSAKQKSKNSTPGSSEKVKVPHLQPQHPNQISR